MLFRWHQTFWHISFHHRDLHTRDQIWWCGSKIYQNIFNFSMCIYFVTLILWPQWWMVYICIIVANTDLRNFWNERNNHSNKLHLFGEWYRFGYLVFCHRVSQCLRVSVDWHIHIHHHKIYISIQLDCDFTIITFILTKLRWVDTKVRKYLAIHGKCCNCFALLW